MPMVCHVSRADYCRMYLCMQSAMLVHNQSFQQAHHVAETSCDDNFGRVPHHEDMA